mgnify:CR=1 FL=1
MTPCEAGLRSQEAITNRQVTARNTTPVAMATIMCTRCGMPTQATRRGGALGGQGLGSGHREGVSRGDTAGGTSVTEGRDGQA